MLRSLVVMALLLLPVACDADGTPTATPVTAAGTPAASASGDTAGLRACNLLRQAVEQATLMDAGVVETIRAAGAAADAPVADAAGRLAAAYTAAVGARGSATEPDAVAAVSAAGVEMTRTCTDAGLGTTG